MSQSDGTFAMRFHRKRPHIIVSIQQSSALSTNSLSLDIKEQLVVFTMVFPGFYALGKRASNNPLIISNISITSPSKCTNPQVSISYCVCVCSSLLLPTKKIYKKKSNEFQEVKTLKYSLEHHYC